MALAKMGPTFVTNLDIEQFPRLWKAIGCSLFPIGCALVAKDVFELVQGVLNVWLNFGLCQTVTVEVVTVPNC